MVIGYSLIVLGAIVHTFDAEFYWRSLQPSTLIENGFDKKQIIYEPAKRFARKDDYAVEIVRNKETYF